MYTLGIPLKQKRRTLGYLSNEYFPGGMKKLGQQVPYEIISTDRNGGFFIIGFPNMDHYEYSDIVLKLKQQGVTVIGADSQLTENNIMKLVNLVPLNENRLSGPFNGEQIKKMVSRDPETMFFANGQYYLATSEFQDFKDDLSVMDRDGTEDYIDIKDIEFAEATHGFAGVGMENEGTCGYGEGGKVGSKPAGQESDLEKLRAFVKETVKETFQDNPDVQGTAGMEDSVNDPSAKAEKILNQLAKAFPDIPLERVVNDSTYKRQAITQILFGMSDLS